MRTLYLDKASYPVACWILTSLLKTKMNRYMNRYNQSTWYLIYSEPPDDPPGTISAQVQIRVSEKQESPEDQVGFMCPEGKKRLLKKCICVSVK